MRHTAVFVIMILGVLASTHGQSKAVLPSRPTVRPTATPQTKPKPPQSKYLATPLDLNKSNVGHNFMGHNITTVVEAIKSSPALKEKSEFESTSEFETRRAGFIQYPLYAGLMPSSYLGFVVAEEGAFEPSFKYDADSQALAVTLVGSSEHFVMDKGEPDLDSVLIRRVIVVNDSYIGCNAFGAKVKVSRSLQETYGIVFDQNNWLIGSGYNFNYSIPMAPNEARALKTELKLMLVCRLQQPWLRQNAFNSDATIDDPHEMIVEGNFLQAVPEQLWIFNQRTGEVVRKLSESSMPSRTPSLLNYFVPLNQD